MPAALKGHRVPVVTLDEGKEFALHGKVAEETCIGSCFALPRHPWQRGTNESTDGLLRECFPKGGSLAGVTEGQVREVCGKLNRRPRKRSGYRTPYEAHYSAVLQLI